MLDCLFLMPNCDVFFHRKCVERHVEALNLACGLTCLRCKGQKITIQLIIQKLHDFLPLFHLSLSLPLSHRAGSPSDSPDSVLKLKLCPPLSFFPNSSSSQSDRSSFDKASRSEYQDQRRQLLSSSSPPPHYTLFESHLGSTSSPTSALESISRGPDGRFIVQPYDEGSTPIHIKKNLKKDFPQCSAGGDSSTSSSRMSYRGSPKSDSIDSESAEKKNPSPIPTVDLPGPSKISHSPGRVKAMARNFSRHGCFYSDDEPGCSQALLERASFYSDSSEKRDCDPLKKYHMSVHPEGMFPSLTRKAREVERGEALPHHREREPADQHQHPGVPDGT